MAGLLPIDCHTGYRYGTASLASYRNIISQIHPKKSSNIEIVQQPEEFSNVKHGLSLV